MPRIWAETIDTHRRQVNDAILDATAELMAEHGPMSVGMSAIAQRAGIGRATLYKYFPDVESILAAWHARDFGEHMQHLKDLSDTETVTLDDLTEFVQLQRRHHAHDTGTDVVGTLAHALAGYPSVIEDAIEPVIATLTELIAGLAQRKEVRADHDPKLLARWLLHVVHAPADLDDRAIAQLFADSLVPRPGPRRAPVEPDAGESRA